MWRINMKCTHVAPIELQSSDARLCVNLDKRMTSTFIAVTILLLYSHIFALFALQCIHIAYT